MIEPNVLSDSTSPNNFRQIEPQTSKRLVEECTAITVWAVRQCFGKEGLLRMIRECRPIEVPIPGGYTFEIWLTYDFHRLVNKAGVFSSLEAGTARIWFVCPKCTRAVAKLFFLPVPGHKSCPDLACRRCHNLTYLSVNCAGNRFYKLVVKPFRRLKRIEERLRFKSLPRAQRQSLEAQQSVIRNCLPLAIEKFGRRTPLKLTQNRTMCTRRILKKRAYKDLKMAQLCS